MKNQAKQTVIYFSANERGLGAPVAYEKDGVTASGSMMVVAAIEQGWLQSRSGRLVVRGVFTKQAEGKDRAFENEIKAYLEQALGDLDWEPIRLDDAGADSVLRVVEAVLDLTKPDDYVIVDPTLGPRSFGYGLVTSLIYVRALMRDVEQAPLLYAEQISAPPTAGFRLHAISGSLELVDRAIEAHKFADALVAQPLWSNFGTMPAGLHDGLRAALSSKAIAGLRNKLPTTSTAVGRAALGLVETKLGALANLASRTAPDTLNLDWLSAEVELARCLVAASRHGDASQVLREWMVNVVLLALGVNEGWNVYKFRKPAERWLNARVRRDKPWDALVKLWTHMRDIRNPISHAGYVGPEATAIPIDGVARLSQELATWWAEYGGRLGPISGVPAPTKVAWFGARPPCDLTEVLGLPVDVVAEALSAPSSKNAAAKQVGELGPEVGWAWLGSSADHLRDALGKAGVLCLGPYAGGQSHMDHR